MATCWLSGRIPISQHPGTCELLDEANWNYRVHDLRHYGAHDALNVRGRSIPSAQKVGHWEDPETLIKIYAKGQEDDIYAQWGEEDFPPIAKVGDELTSRLQNATALVDRVANEAHRALAGVRENGRA